MQALLMTPRGIAFFEVEDPAPPRFEYYLPADGEPNHWPWSKAPIHVGFLLRGAGQETSPIYEVQCAE